MPWAVLFAFTGACLWSQFRAAQFPFHDLTIINDMMANAVYEGRPFYVTDWDFFHLQRHFTPTLFLLIPLYTVARSQFVLVAVDLLAFYGAIAIMMRLFERALESLDVGARARAALGCGLVTVFALNVYVKTALLSPHFEQLFTPGACALVYLLLTGGPTWALWTVAALTLGVRQDCGFFLVFVLASLPFAPRALVTDRRRMLRRCGALAFFALAYMALIVGGVMPRMGAQDTRFWAHYGNSWPQVAWTMLTSPGRVLDNVLHSGFLHINRSFFFLLWASPVMAVINNLPGILFYTASTPDKRNLWLYNTSFLLPGMMTSTIAGLHVLWRGLAALARWRPRFERVLMGLPVALVLVLAVASVLRVRVTQSPYSFGLHAPVDNSDFLSALDRYVARCREHRALAGDGWHMTLVPNGYPRYTLPNFAKADVVFIPSDSMFREAGYPGPENFQELTEARAQLAQSKVFHLVEQLPRLRVYVSEHAPPCTPRDGQ